MNEEFDDGEVGDGSAIAEQMKNNQQQEEIFQVLQLWRCKMAEKRGQAYFLVL